MNDKIMQYYEFSVSWFTRGVQQESARAFCNAFSKTDAKGRILSRIPYTFRNIFHENTYEYNSSAGYDVKLLYYTPGEKRGEKIEHSEIY